MKTSNILWSQFVESLANSMGSGRSKASIQVLPHARSLPSAATTAADLEDELGLFVNAVPLWGSAYTVSDKEVVLSYQSILQQIQPTSVGERAAYQDYKADLAAATQAATEARQYLLDKVAKYRTQKIEFGRAGLPPPAWDDFWASYAPGYKAKQEYSVGLSNIVLQGLAATAGPSQYVQAVKNLNNWLESSSANPLPPFNYVTPPFPTLNAWIRGRDLAAKGLSIHNSSARYDYSRSVWKKSSDMSVFFGLWKETSESEDSAESIISDSSRYTISVAFAAQALFAVQPHGKWFNGTLLRDFKHGPWAKGSPFDTGESTPWGPDGILPLMVSGFYAIYQPTITIQLDEESYRDFLSSYSPSRGDGFRFGPFSQPPRAGGGPNDSWKISTDDATETVTIQDLSNIPQIIGVVNQVMP